MKKLLLPFLFFSMLVSSKAFANMDSLLGVWNDESLGLEMRLNAIDEVCSVTFINTDPASAKVFLELAKDMASGVGLDKQLAQSERKLGIAAKVMSDFQKAMSHLRTSISIYERIGDSAGLLSALNSYGNVQLAVSGYEEAIKAYNQALKIAEALDDQQKIANLQSNIGLIQMDIGDYAKSLNYLNDGLKIFEELGLTSSKSNALNNIGTVYRNQEKFHKALDFYKESLSLVDENEKTIGLAIRYSNIGLVYREQGDAQKGVDYIEKSLQIHRDLGNKKGVANCLIHIASGLQGKDDESALEHAESALSIAKQIGSIEEEKKAAKLLHELYDAKGDYKMALEMHELYLLMKDEMLNSEKQMAIIGEEQKYINEKTQIKQEQFRKEAEAEQKRERMLLLGGMLLAIIGLWYFAKRRVSAIERERKELVEQLNEVKQRLAKSAIISTGTGVAKALDKERIEKAIQSKLGDSSWSILNLIYDNPSISNAELAERMSMTVEGVSSSLRRMYKSFNINVSSNKKVTLVMKATKLSAEPSR